MNASLSAAAPVALSTERLRLAVPVSGDAAEIFAAYASDQEVTRYLSWRPHRTIVETSEFLAVLLTMWEHGEAFPWTVRLKKDNQLIGMIEGRPNISRLEIGYVLARSHWGAGYMTEALRVVVQWALSQPQFHRVWAVCDLENSASARVMEKAGMVNEGILRRWIILPNRSSVPRDCYCYSIIKP